MEALKYACGLSKLVGHAKIEICYDVDYVSLPGAVGKSPESAPDLLVEEGARILSKARAVARKEGMQVTQALIRGNTTDAIERHALEVGADLIVMGTHGRGGLGRMLLGSVAEGVVRRSAVPVLLVREKK
jgi:nucleotide-binding universal stress UspA family protein